MATNALKRYRGMRDFRKTPEPRGAAAIADGAARFVIQKHAARQLHYDLRLEMEGTFKSWAVPKGPSLDPADKRMAVHVEDHPLEYGDFEGDIPAGQYGAGTVVVWDRGTWEPLGDAAQDYAAGKLKFILHGQRLAGAWALIRMKSRRDPNEPWLLIKERDAYARPAAQVETADALPLALAPQLATLVDAPPSGDEWAFELKFDGYRMLARVDGDDVRLFTRNGHDWTRKLTHLVVALRALRLDRAWLDGEIVVVTDAGRTDFQALQSAFEEKGGAAAIRFYLFDLPYHAGCDLRQRPLHARREALQAILRDAPPPLHFSDSFGHDGSRLMKSVAALGGEGVIGKRLESHYVSGRSMAWVKVKTTQRQEFVVVGYTDPRGSRTGVGALALAVVGDGGRLESVGSVGSGLAESGMPALMNRLRAIGRSDSPLASVPTGLKAHWVEPRLVVEVAFTGWTREGSIRHPVFKGFRSDKEAGQVTRERPVAAPATQAERMNTMNVTHAARVIDASTGITKGELVEYYRAVAPDLFAAIVGRPLALVRAPNGLAGSQFFQKQPDTLSFDGLVPVVDGDAILIMFHSAGAIASAAQMNTVEFHPWNATVKALEKPDRVVFDLDPGAGVGFDRVREAALLVQTLLRELGLVAFVKTSGGKGLHVVVPIAARRGWEAVHEFSAAVVRHLERMAPTRFVSKTGARNRVGKILIDVGRNLRGSTTVASYSARARAGLGVSMPVSWDELESVQSGDQWTIANALPRLDASRRAWALLPKTRQALSNAVIERLPKV